MTGWEREWTERRGEYLVLGPARDLCTGRGLIVLQHRTTGERVVCTPNRARFVLGEPEPEALEALAPAESEGAAEAPPALEGPDLTQHRALADRLARETKEPHLVLPHGDNGNGTSCSRGWLPYVVAEPRASAWERKNAVYRTEGGVT